GSVRCVSQAGWLRCERPPTGVLALPKEKEDVWRDSDEVSPT
ncbi:hypothetical protein GQX54_05750, partial [Staphylococcus aureus]|nr:hypothetical protein [Staphylococcus aureus]